MSEMPEDEREKHLIHQSGVNAAGEPFIQLILDGRIIAQLSYTWY